MLRKQVVSSWWAGFCCLLLLSVWVLGWDHSIVGIQRWCALGGVKQLCKRAAIVTLLPEVGNEHLFSCVRSILTDNKRSCSIEAVDTSAELKFDEPSQVLAVSVGFQIRLPDRRVVALLRFDGIMLIELNEK